MDRRSIPNWTSLTAIFIVFIFVFSGIVHHHSVNAANAQRAQHTSGLLRGFDQDGNPIGECPLKHTEVKARVSGFLSRVTVTQIFENPFTDKIEAVYTFPLPQAAAVDDLTMLIGDRVIKGQVMRRQDAKAAYDTAKQMGKTASLLDQQRENVFTQQVANILPGQQIRVTISYVETLKYEDGSYEWSFPMVVAERYNAVPDANDVSEVNDSSHLSPPITLDATRPGHDISLEIDLDAGVPLLGIGSETHETAVQQINDKRAVVRLKDRTTIPNKDFILTYRVAGENINDAVLAHRSERGGFFTLILQPPQRVFPQDVMPKEIVFVLDTSGSMSGFPIETAKQTMQLALDTLNPHDTFNLITFSGDTDILFPEPVPATPENLRKAKKFISNREGEGGTEMMKAIKAALDPSDSQYHVRLACFMTDGQVGNEKEILAELQKHPNARVFAMGFGSAPNRYLLDKMATYGRGEVDYVPDTGGTAPIARRFNERVRNPLLTDLSIDWSDLPITEVYPKRIPDLFSAKPLIVSGRYSKGAKGTIRLKGKMAGQDFVREIPVELPEVEDEHDVLANLWARRRIDDLMAEEIASAGDQTARDQKREEITQLGLTFKLMTQYTSFIAIDDVIFTGPEEPRRVDVPAHMLSQTLPSVQSGPMALVTVSSSIDPMVLTAGTQTTIRERSVGDLPLQGRGFYSLVPLASGVVASGAGSSPADSQMQNRRNILAQSSNSFLVDGVDANFGIAQGGQAPGPSASGNAPALTVSGAANGIATLDAIQEITVHTLPALPEYRGPEVTVTTRGGTNEFHGSAFHFFGNDRLDANDWFANARGLNKPAKRLNLFGATFGGPIDRDKTFFFVSYEGLRLRQPMVGVTDVPSLPSRQAAPAALRSFFEAFPTPNGALRPDGFAEFAATFANPARHDVASFRLDHMINSTTSLQGRYNFAESSAEQRGTNGSSLNTTNRIRSRSQTITGSLARILSPTVVFDLRGNYSRLRVNGSYLLDGFGGGVIPDNPFPTSFGFDLNSRNAALMIGDEASNVQRQFHLVGSTSIVSGNHTWKFGADFRRLSPIIDLRPSEEIAFFDGMTQALTGVAGRLSSLNYTGPQTPVFNSLSLYLQDEWRLRSRLTITYGTRWELAPPPSSDEALAVDQVNDATTLQTLGAGKSLWKTTFANFAPRGGIAYELTRRNNRELVLRGGVGVVYDLSRHLSGDAFAASIPFISGSSVFNSPFPIALPPVTTSEGLPFMAFDPHLKLPYTLNWNISLAQALGHSQAISATYTGSSGKRLSHVETLFDQNPDFLFLRLITNRASSDYRGLQIRFDRQMSGRLATLVTYTWSQSLDNVSDDSARHVIMSSLNPELDRGRSDFDIEHQFGGFVSYGLPAPFSSGLGNKLSRNWCIDSIFTARSAKPVNVLFAFPTSFGLAYLRPDLVNGAPLYVLDPTAPGGRRINAEAFVPASDLQQGNLARNSLLGFPLHQVDLALRRKFNFTEDLAVQVQADAFNVFNQANFEDPLGNDLVLGDKLAFGESTALNGRSLSRGGFGSFYSFGEARTLRLSLKLIF